MTAFSPLTTRRLDDVIACVGDVEIRVDEFLGQVNALAESLPQQRYVINLATNRYTFLLGFCAAIVAGQCTLLPPNRQRETVRDIEVSAPQTARETRDSQQQTRIATDPQAEDFVRRIDKIFQPRVVTEREQRRLDPLAIETAQKRE